MKRVQVHHFERREQLVKSCLEKDQIKSCLSWGSTPCLLMPAHGSAGSKMLCRANVNILVPYRRALLIRDVSGLESVAQKIICSAHMIVFHWPRLDFPKLGNEGQKVTLSGVIYKPGACHLEQ